MTSAVQAFGALLRVIERLQRPDGCPWDREQTPDSLFPYLIEEVWEAYEARQNGSAEAFLEEMGDVFYTVLFMQAITDRQALAQTIAQVVEQVTAKMIARHPHVFGQAKAHDVQEALAQWQASKRGTEDPAREERLKRTRTLLFGIVQALYRQPECLGHFEAALAACRALGVPNRAQP
jgi:uncharacterized protein YabN with tetrapyrrole methylase and pyrophosphatase domain